MEEMAVAMGSLRMRTRLAKRLRMRKRIRSARVYVRAMFGYVNYNVNVGPRPVQLIMNSSLSFRSDDLALDLRVLSPKAIALCRVHARAKLKPRPAT